MIELSDDPMRLDFEVVHRWLAGSYWSPGIERALVEKAAAGSHCVGAYADGAQVGYARMITDRATFAWLTDVFVDPATRGRGVATRMMRFFLDQPDYAGIRRMMLATMDAHEVYRPFGFSEPVRPDRLMERLAPAMAALMRDGV